PNYGRVSFAGALTSDVPADAREMALTADHLFVAGSAGVAVFALDVTSGLPSPAGVRTEEGSWNPLQLAATPDGSQLFVASLNAPYLRRYAIGDEGALALADSLAE